MEPKIERPRILFVDDEPTIRATLPEILHLHGFEVTSASTVGEALAAMSSQRFDILLSDLNIGQPGDGFTIVSAMHRLHPETVTLLLTGYPDFQTALEAIRQQVDGYLLKPIEIPDLVKTLQQTYAERNKRPIPKQGKRVAQIVRENQSSIIEGWLKAVEKNPDVAAIKLTKDERIDHLPQKITELALMLESGTEGMSEKQMRGAYIHGEVRLSQGYSVRMLMEETRILEQCIFQVLQSQLLELDISSLIPDMIRVVDSSQIQQRVMLEAFLGEEARRPRAA